MPANIDTMFSVREMPWHGEGFIADAHPESWDEARKLAGLTWDVEAVTSYARREVSNEDGIGHLYEPEEGWRRIVRNDTGATLWHTRDSYSLITMQDMGEIVEAVLEQAGVKYETAGALEGGRKVWALAYLDEPITLPGDNSETYPFMALQNPFGQPGGATLRATGVRIVCGNTWRAAELEGERSGLTFSFAHRGNWRDRIEEARAAVRGTRTEMAKYTEMMTDLLGVTVTEQQRRMFVNSFIASPPDGEVSDRVAKNITEARAALSMIFESETTAPVAHTAYGLLQGAGEYLDHVRRARSWETRLGRTILRPESGKARALQTVRDVLASA